MPKQGIYGQHGRMGMGLHQKMDPDGSDEGMDRQNPWFRNGSIQDLGPLIGGMFGAQPSMLGFFVWGVIAYLRDDQRTRALFR